MIKVSVVIPCRNEVSSIVDCVDAIFQSEGFNSGEIEVIVVDGLSDDGTLGTLENVKYQEFSVVENKHQTAPFAFNIGIKASRGVYVQIVGARQIISKNYLKECVNSLESDPQIWCVGGSVENIYLNATARVIAKAMDSPFGVGSGNFRLAKESKFVDTVGTPMYRKDTFDKIGLFNEDLVRNQDDELNYRVTNNGGKILLNAKARIKYFVRASYRNLFKQYFQYGYWKVYVNQMHRTITSWRQLIPAVLILCFGVGIPLAGLGEGFFLLFFLFLNSYVGAAMIFAGKKCSNFKEWALITYSFFILHVSYGVGYWKGIIDFLILRKKPAEKSKQLSR